MAGVAWLLQPQRGQSMANFLAKAKAPLDVRIVGQTDPAQQYTLQ
jgi:hypothetical protein